MKRFIRQANDTIKLNGQLFQVRGGVFTREFRQKRLPVPAPRPLDPEVLQLVRDAAVTKPTAMWLRTW